MKLSVHVSSKSYTTVTHVMEVTFLPDHVGDFCHYLALSVVFCTSVEKGVKICTCINQITVIEGRIMPARMS